MKWENPPIIKIYEALGAVSDDRVEILSENTAKVYSSTRNKFYDVTYDPEKKLIMTNDNGSYWKGYLGYPAVAYLMKINVLSYDNEKDPSAFDELRAQTSLKHLCTKKSFPSWNPKTSLDYVLLSDDFNVSDFYVQKEPAFSDHLALIVKAELAA